MPTASQDVRSEQCLEERSWADDEKQDTESHRRMAAEQELKVAEKTGEHQDQIGTQIEVEKQKAAELRNRVQTVKKSA